MHTRLQESPTPSHSNELENRLTKAEIRGETQEKRLDATERRLSLQEKAILAIAAVLQIILQDKYPALANIIKSLAP